MKIEKLVSCIHEMLVTSIKSAKNSVPTLGYCGYNPFQVLKLSHHENDKEVAFHSPLFSSISGTCCLIWIVNRSLIFNDEVRRINL